MRKKKDKKLSDSLLADDEPVKKERPAWSAERRAAFEAAKASGKTRRKKGGQEASVLGILTYLRHAGEAVMGDIRDGGVTLRTIPRKDVLVLLAYVDMRDRT